MSETPETEPVASKPQSDERDEQIAKLTTEVVRLRQESQQLQQSNAALVNAVRVQARVLPTG